MLQRLDGAYSRCDKYLWFRSASGMLVHRRHVTGMSENTHNCTFQKGNSVAIWAMLRESYPLSGICTCSTM